MRAVIKELKSWNWPAIAALTAAWAVVFYETLK